MKFNEMKEIDLKLFLLGGSSIKLENLEIKPYTLAEIRDYGYSNYINNLQWASLTIDDFIDSILDDDKKDFLEEQRKVLKTFDFYIKLGGQEMQLSLLATLSMIFRTDDIRILDNDVIGIGFIELGILTEDEEGDIVFDEDVLESLEEDDIKIIHRDNFDDIISIVKLQNYLEKPSGDDEIEENPIDKETQLLQEHMRKMREKVENMKRAQSDDEDKDIDISDVISAVSSKSNSINKFNIWDFTLYQIYDEYARLELIDNYDFSIRAMMAGAEKVDLKHWSSRI